MADREMCHTCKFFLAEGGPPEGGVCRRYPPTLAWGQANGQLLPAASAYPPVLYKHWCGEWAKGSLVQGVQKMPPSAVDIGPGSN